MTTDAPVLKLSPFEASVLRHAVERGAYESAEWLALQMIGRGLLRDDGLATPSPMLRETPDDAKRLARLPRKEREAAIAARNEAQAALAARRRLCATDAGIAALAAHDEAQKAALAATPSFADEVAAMLARCVVKPYTEAELRAQDFDQVIAPRLRGSGFGAEHIRDLVEWNCEPQRKAFDVAMEALRTRGAIVALIGKRGTGKTMIAAQVCAQWAREDLQAVRRGIGMCRATPYVKLTDLLARFKALFADFGTRDPEALAERRDYFCSRNELIVIDEIGECDASLVRHHLITDFVDRIYSAQQRAILISNQTPEEFEEKLGKSAYSRLTQYGVILRCSWDSWRERK